MDKTVAKAIHVFETLAASAEPCGISELASRTGYGKSNVHRLLGTLKTLGYVNQDEGGLYSVTLKVWEIGIRIVERIDVRAIARPELVELAKRCGESVHLSRLDGGDVIYIDKIESDNPVRAYTQVGGRAPAHCTATGKALLAFAPDPDLAAIGRSMQAFTPRTLKSMSALREALGEVRAQGYALNNGEWRAHVSGLAAAVLDHRGEVIAAIGISGPIERLKPAVLKGFAPDVMATAARVSHRLGFVPTLRAGRSGETVTERPTGGTRRPK